MKKEDMAALMQRVFVGEIMALRKAGQSEYAHGLEDDAFNNFKRVAADLNLDMKEVLWIYARKHIDGIIAHIAGHHSQRENVRGRINDLIVYLFLLRGMVEEEDEQEERWVETISVSAGTLKTVNASDAGLSTAQSLDR